MAFPIHSKAAAAGTGRADDGRAAAWPYALPILAAVLAAAFYSRFWLSHDDSWYLIATRKFIEGARLYVDVMEVNPPLNFYLTAPALYLADLSGLSDTVAYVLQVCVLGGLSGLWLTRVVLRSDLDRREQAALVAVGLIGLFLLPISEFAQREHLLLVFALPYFMLLVVGPDRIAIGRAEQFAIGLAGMLGLALKPHFLLIPAAIAIVGPWRGLPRRMFAPANLGLAAGLLAYALFTLAAHPEYFSGILGVASKIYGAFGRSTFSVLARWETVAVVLFALYVRGRLAGDATAQRLSAATGAAFLAYLAQFKGWNYHLIPFDFFIGATVVWIAVHAPAPRSGKLARGATAAAIVACTLGVQLERGPYDPVSTRAFAPFIERKGETIMVYSTNVSAAFPFVNAVEGTWASRYPAQWTIPGAYRELQSPRCLESGDPCAEYRRILEDTRVADTEDLVRYRPDLVFVEVRENKSYFGGVPFDFLVFLKEDPSFAREWAHYRKVGSVGKVVDVWRRTPLPNETAPR